MKKIGITGEKGLAGQVLDVVSLTDYQDDAVVSKTLLKKKVGTVTMFAFDSGQGLSEHTAPYDAMVLIVDGQAEITVGGEMKLVKAGEMLILPANVPHSLDAVERFKMMLVMVRSD